ncbi:BglG family transcription antiterminator [Lacrimispora sp. JR3]|uniref:BglG family transcription antiterminator n=1 Tax=Lacrimispora sinapis TaxID=3111456 RepID=UPI003747D150
MFPYGRLNDIFNDIKKHDYVSPDRLADKFHVTDRTIRGDIQEINGILNGHGARVKLKRKFGYYVEITDPPAYEHFQERMEAALAESMELDSSEDRIRYILSMLLFASDYIPLEQIMDTVFISKNTLSNYIRTLKRILDKYGLEYISKPNLGIKVIGSEKDKRRCIMERVITSDNDSYLTGFAKEERLLFPEVDLDYLKKVTLDELKKRSIDISDYNLKNLIIHLALLITRVKSNHYITVESIETDCSIMAIINSLCGEIEAHYGIAISKGEKLYMYLHMVTNTHMEATEIDDEWLRRSIGEALEIIYKNYNFDLRADKALLSNLFRHMKSIFISKSFGLNIRNPLLNTIKNNYSLAFEISLTAFTQVFDTPPFTLNEEDVGYVAVHVCAAIEVFFSKGLKKKKVFLVCGNGLAALRMLETRLGMYFDGQINIVRTLSCNEYMDLCEESLKEADCTISTSPLNDERLPSITVDFALKNKDIESIARFFTAIDAAEKEKKSGFFEEDLFFRLHHVSGKEELLTMLCRRLKEKGFVETDFIDSVLEREKLGRTNMNELFALAHPMSLCARNTKVAVAILEKPLVWNRDECGQEETVQIVFLLAINQEMQKDLVHLYDSMIEIVNNSKLQQRLISSDSFEKFIAELHAILPV